MLALAVELDPVVVPVGVPATTPPVPPVAVTVAVEVSVWLAKVVFRAIGIPVPPEDAAVPARVVVKSVGLIMVVLVPLGPAMIMAVATDVDEVDDIVVDVVVDPPTSENSPE